MSPTRRQFLAATAATTTCGVAAPTQAQPPKPVPGIPHYNPYKLGLVTYNTAAQWDLPTLLKVCKNTGIAAVECRTTHKHGVEPTLTADQRAEVKKRFADSGVVFWGCGSVCEFHSPDPAVVKKNVETCHEFVKLVHDLGGTMVKVRPNGLPKGVEVEKTLEQIGKALVQSGKAAEEYGVEICVEVHGAGTQDPPNMKAIMEHCGHKSVGITWNSNPTDVKDGSVKASFDLLKRWLKSCHINDLYKQHLDKGAYPYRELFRLLREHGYARYTLIEVGRTPPDVATGEEFLRYYKALWTELARG
jgi:sugar phosphate isomerase/epimerase